MKTLIINATIVNENVVKKCSLLIDNESIAGIYDDAPKISADETIDASGCYVIPGVIDEHVHFREPGLTRKADIESESRAAVAGGVTTYFDMPNTVPQTVTLEALDNKFQLAKNKSHVNYSFFYGATNSNVETFGFLDDSRIPGIKLFMGASTGNMLVDDKNSLDAIFSHVSIPLMCHCEDTSMINRNMEEMKSIYGSDPKISLHPRIRNAEACYRSSALAVSLARKYDTRLHIAHISTARELDLFNNNLDMTERITAEAVVGHLFFSDEDYSRLGALIKCNPAIKGVADRDALRKAVVEGKITAIATDHAPHLLTEKQGGAARAMSGMPSIQFSLPMMLELVDMNVMSIERLVQLMCHHPSQLFDVINRGFIRVGYKADITIVKPHEPWRVTEDCIQSKCGWSPLTGHQFEWKVVRTIVNGHTVYCDGRVHEDIFGEEVKFKH